MIINKVFWEKWGLQLDDIAKAHENLNQIIADWKEAQQDAEQRNGYPLFHVYVDDQTNNMFKRYLIPAVNIFFALDQTQRMCDAMEIKYDIVQIIKEVQ